jgi:hypothetical protein
VGFAVADTPDNWILHYDERNSCRLSMSPLTSNCELIHAICIERPCQDRRLWDSLLGVMQLGNVVLYWPGTDGPLIASEVVGRHLPADLVHSLGQPVRVQDGDGIRGRIEAS